MYYHNRRTIVGVKCSDGIILGAEKLVFSKMLVEGTNRRIYNIEKKIGMVVAGRIPDGRHIVQHARTESDRFEKEYEISFKGGKVKKVLCRVWQRE
jgi:20S proteasome subunit alpha 7